MTFYPVNFQLPHFFNRFHDAYVPTTARMIVNNIPVSFLKHYLRAASCSRFPGFHYIYFQFAVLQSIDIGIVAEFIIEPTTTRKAEETAVATT